MFEQATLNGGPLSTRLWSTCAGMSGQILLVGATLLVPLIWPAALPQLQSYIQIVAPGPPPPPPPPPIHGATVQPRGTARPFPGAVTLPPRVPDRVEQVVEELPQAVSSGVSGGVQGGIGGGVDGGVLGSILASTHAAPAPTQTRVVERTQPAPEPVSVAPPRIVSGGLVKLGAPIHRVEPVYPQLARAARIEGVVELEAVVGVDGRVRELRAKNGHAFLVKAALEAVRQWIYTPTTLNGNPVEVISPIQVTFRLGNR